ncbi:MAG: hypothetical protein WCX91_05975 [Candidatus Omnitrophota bacterium]|jgi:hypothetical protein
MNTTDKELQITKERLVELRDSHLIKLAHPECELYEKHLTKAIDFIQQYFSIKGVSAEAQISKAQEAFFVSQGRMSNRYDMYNQAKGFNQARRELILAMIKEREELNNSLREIANDLGAPVTSWTAECQTGEFEGIIERATKAIHKLLKIRRGL